MLKGITMRRRLGAVLIAGGLLLGTACAPPAPVKDEDVESGSEWTATRLENPAAEEDRSLHDSYALTDAEDAAMRSLEALASGDYRDLYEYLPEDVHRAISDSDFELLNQVCVVPSRLPVSVRGSSLTDSEHAVVRLSVGGRRVSLELERPESEWRWSEGQLDPTLYEGDAEQLILDWYAQGKCPGATENSWMDNPWSCPPSLPVKGNRSVLDGDLIYHQRGWKFYPVTDPERCFASAAEAEANGFRASQVR